MSFFSKEILLSMRDELEKIAVAKIVDNYVSTIIDNSVFEKEAMKPLPMVGQGGDASSGLQLNFAKKKAKVPTPPVGSGKTPAAAKPPVAPAGPKAPPVKVKPPAPAVPTPKPVVKPPTSLSPAAKPTVALKGMLQLPTEQ